MSHEIRSFGAVTFSLALHAAIFFALFMAPETLFHLNKPVESDVEFSADESQPNDEPAVAAPAVAQQPSPLVTPKVDKPVAVAPIKSVKAQPKAKPVAQVIPVAEPIHDEVADNQTEAVAPKEVTEAPQTPPESVESAVAAQQAADEEPIDKATPEAIARPEKQTQVVGGQNSNGADEFGRSYLTLRQRPGNVAPQYPMDARREQRQGQVDLVYYVMPDGSVKDIRVIKSSGHADLDQAAESAVGKFKYYPGQEGWTEHPVSFSLRGPAEPEPLRLRTGSPAQKGSNG